MTSGPEAQHASQLTVRMPLSAVHYITFAVDEAARVGLAAGDVRLAIDHPEYRYETTIDADDVNNCCIRRTERASRLAVFFVNLGSP